MKIETSAEGPNSKNTNYNSKETITVYYNKVQVRQQKFTLGSSGFFCKSWFKTSMHSENFPDWKCKAASLASAAATDRTASSSFAEDPSRFTAVDDDEDESRASITGSINQNQVQKSSFVEMR